MLSASDFLSFGYLNPGYAASLRPFGVAIKMRRSGGWLLKRPIPNSESYDLAGPYPLFLCNRLSSLPSDLAELRNDNLASAVLVCDPFLDRDVEAALTDFELLKPYKTHFLARPDASWDKVASKHHRYYARKALSSAEYQLVEEPQRFAGEFWGLYQNLIDRFELTGIQALSRSIIEAQLAIPGALVITARIDSEVVSACIWYEMEGRAYLHLHAQSEEARRKSIGYGIYAYSIMHFRGKVEWLDFGGAAGATDHEINGLRLFKKGWATDTKTTYLCGKILNPVLYEKLSMRASNRTDFFPSYRTAHPRS